MFTTKFESKHHRELWEENYRKQQFRQDPIHIHKKSWPPNESYKKMMIMNLKRPWDMQLQNENISYEKPLALWVTMNLRIMEMMEVNKPEPTEVD